MKVKFLDAEIPEKYSLPIKDSGFDKNKDYEGRTYTLLGCSEKTFALRHRVWVGIRAFWNTLCSIGSGLSEKVRDDWKSFWNGKRKVVLYSASTFFTAKFLADKGDSFGQATLGYLYYTGAEGVEQSDTKAFKYYRFVADKDRTDSGTADAQFNVGRMYEQGKGVEQSDTKAAHYYSLSADKGHPEAQFLLGCMYRDGRGVQQSDQETFKYFRLAADQGKADVQFLVGCMYQIGKGVEQSDQEAVRYYRLAAAQGNSDAQSTLRSRGLFNLR